MGDLGQALSGCELAVGVRATQQTTQLTPKHASGHQVDVEVARVVRQPHLLDERADVGVDHVSTPRRVGGDVRHV